MATPSIPKFGAPQVVVAFLDGRRPKGFMFDFLPTRDRCKLFPSQTAKAEEGEEIEIKKLKAIFFLREVSEETSTNPTATTGGHGRKLEVLFPDREILVGTTEGYSRERLGFFMVPYDPAGKILRAFIINANVKSVKWL